MDPKVKDSEGVGRKRIMDELSEEKKINEFYPFIDVFVLSPFELPNDVEGFGIVYLEANAYGIPVVASKTGGVPDTIKENVSGVFADPTNPEDIADKILFIINTLEEWEQRCKEHVENFDVRKMSKQFKELYEKVIE